MKDIIFSYENTRDGRAVIHSKNSKSYAYALTYDLEAELKRNVAAFKKNVLVYSTDDAGNIDCFLSLFKDCVRYNIEHQAFYYWTGRVWRKDSGQQIQYWAELTMRLRRDFTRKKLSKHASTNSDLQAHIKKCCNQHEIRAIVEGIKSHLCCYNEKFDSTRNLLNVLNGTIDLETGMLNKHNRNNYITMLIPYAYDNNATSKKFQRFLKDTFKDEKLIKYMQRLLGYCLTGETGEQEVYFAYGSGANGKSTLLSLVRYIMNDYAAVIPSKTITSFDKTGAATSEIAQLPRKRLVCCSELNCNDILNEGKIKVMSGGETLAARELYGKAFTFDPEFKFFVDTNYLPKISGTDHGIWRRIKVIPFNNIVPNCDIDKYLSQKLKKDATAVLAWLVHGAVRYYAKGLKTVKTVRKTSKTYRTSQDTLGCFIEARIRDSKHSEVRARDLYDYYVEFCNDNLLTPMSETKFGRDMNALGFKRSKDKVSRKYVNIELV